MNETKKESARRPFAFPYRNTLEKAVSHLSFSERLIFYVLAVALSLSTLVIVFRLNDYLLVEVPAYGGSIAEGIIGSPRFINPVLAISDADRDLTSLVYSGLLKTTPDGTLVPDLAESYSISEDGLIYTFIIKNNIFFQDGTPVSADDVEFTILKAQDSAIKSPKRANWDSVKVEKVGDREIRFTLKQPYAPFLQNTTMGILPKHIWKDVSNDEFALSYFNIEPIGSGPFMIDSITRNSSGIPQKYQLSPFKNYALGEPYLSSFTLSFYSNEAALIDAFKRGDIESINSITPDEVKGLPMSNQNLITTPLSRIFAVFFNQNEAPIFADIHVREALNEVVNKEALVQKVLFGFGMPIDGPVPTGLLDEQKSLSQPTTTPDEQIQNARAILEKDGWTLNGDGIYQRTNKKKKMTEMLSFSLSTSDVPELKEAALIIKDTWEKIGAKVDLKIFESGDLSQNIIRPRKYDALLFGEIIGQDLDLFAFWHSSQRDDPGLNIALYTNTKTDKLLSDARTISDRSAELEKYRQFETELQKDTPAVFLYSPSFVYILPKKVKGAELSYITVPSDRFADVNDWYTETEKVWKIFMSKRLQKQ